MKRITALILGVIMLSGCAAFKPYESLSAKDKATVSVETLSGWYDNTHKALEMKYANSDEETRELLRKEVNPKMNKLRPMIIKYDKLVLLWVETNTKPQDMTTLVSEIENLILGIMSALK